MRVLHVNNLYWPDLAGGAEMSVHDLAVAQAELGNEVAVAALRADRAASSEIADGVTIARVPLWNLYWPFDPNRPDRSSALRSVWHLIDIDNRVMGRRLGALIDRWRPDVVHTHCIAGHSVAAWRAARQRGVPIIHTVRDYYLICPRSTMMAKGRNCERACRSCGLYSARKRRASAQVEAVCAVSSFILERHLSAGYFNRASIREAIHHSCDPCPVCLSAKSAQTTPEGPIRLGYLGRLLPEKGIELLLESLPYESAANWSLAIAGNGPEDYEKSPRRRMHDPRVRFVGWQAPDTFLHDIDVLVVPSLWHEPGGRVLPEAFRHGVPVVVSNRGGGREQVEEGVTGLIFDPGDPRALKACLRRIVEDQSAVATLRSGCLQALRLEQPASAVEKYQTVYRRMTATTSLRAGVPQVTV